MHAHTNWAGVVWPKTGTDQDLLNRDFRADECLRQSAKDLGKVHIEHLFYRKEMDCTRELAPWLKKSLYLGCKILSEFGHSSTRPAAGLCALWLVWRVIYAVHFWPKAELALPQTKL
jgi:hypothetical protein